MNGLHSRLIGAILLVAGITVGAAMLALPVSTGRSGFFPSLVTMVFVWAYLAYAALCLLEVQLSLPKDSNLVSMAEHTLGRVGKWISWSAYLFLLYALNTAYLAGTISLFQDVIFQITGREPPSLLCAIPQLLVFALLLRGSVRTIDSVNRLCMSGLLLSFCILIMLAFPYIETKNFTSHNWIYVLPSFSIVLTAFGFHVIIPSLVSYLDSNVKDLKRAIWIGSLIPLIAYIVWQATTLGVIPLKGPQSIETAYETGMTGSQLLGLATQNSKLNWIDETFGFFAIITSFLGVSMSLFDFLVDGLKTREWSRKTWKIFLIAFVPPLYFALSYKRAFFSALEYAGAFGVVILLALIPALMTWRKRYVLHLPSAYTAPGGKKLLIIFIGISFCFVILEALIKIEGI